MSRFPSIRLNISQDFSLINIIKTISTKTDYWLLTPGEAIDIKIYFVFNLLETRWKIKRI